MKNSILCSVCLFFVLAFSSAVLAQEPEPVKAKKRSDAERKPSPVFQADAITFDSTVSLSELKEQKIARISIMNDTAGALKAGYGVLSYTFILITKKDSKAEDSVYKVVSATNSLAPIKGVLEKASAGSFIMFTDIRTQLPGGKVIYMVNAACTLKE